MIKFTWLFFINEIWLNTCFVNQKYPVLIV